MPNIQVDGPVLKDVDKKRILVEELTNATAKAYGLPREAIVVLIKENSAENVGVGGTLLIDKKEMDK